jgi:hypothetical protein
MKLPRQLIEAVSSQAESRYTLSGVLFDPKKGLLVATNGCVIAAIPAISEKNDELGLISLRGWKLARALAKRIPRKLREGAGKVAVSFQVLKHKLVVRGHDETTVLPKLTGTFPQWEGIFTSLKPKYTITINVDLLYNLALALCEPGHGLLVTLHAEASDKGFAVVPERGEGVGVQMPCRSNHETLADRLKLLGIKAIASEKE